MAQHYGVSVVGKKHTAKLKLWFCHYWNEVFWLKEFCIKCTADAKKKMALDNASVRPHREGSGGIFCFVCS